MSRITQQTWEQIVTQVLALAALAITIGNQAGWWTIGDGLQQSIIQTLTVALALLTTLLYTLNSKPNAEVARLVAMHADAAYDKGHLVGYAAGKRDEQIARLPEDSIEPFPTSVPAIHPTPLVKAAHDYKGDI